MGPKLLRIIDANANRAVEGIRVMEEITRFVVENKRMTDQLKLMRSRIRRIVLGLAGKERRLKQRKALQDVGRKLYSKSEAKRRSIADVFSANAKRAQEALRVLEEFSKLIDPQAGKVFKGLRFKLYEIEKKVFLALVSQQ